MWLQWCRSVRDVVSAKAERAAPASNAIRCWLRSRLAPSFRQLSLYSWCVQCPRRFWLCIIWLLNGWLHLPTCSALFVWAVVLSLVLRVDFDCRRPHQWVVSRRAHSRYAAEKARRWLSLEESSRATVDGIWSGYLHMCLLSCQQSVNWKSCYHNSS